MATSALPAVIDALVTLATAALPSVTVIDGVGISGSPGDYLMIGVDDPDADRPATAGDVQQVRATMSGARDETGTVTCCAYSWNGNGDQKAARDAAFATVAAVENILRTTSPTLGVSAVLKTEFGDRTTVSQAQTETGTDCLVIFSVAYLARI
jgi:hypothetical protein